MKNLIIALLVSYVFWTDIAVIHPLPLLPLMVLCFWLAIAAVDDVVTDYKDRIRKGRRLQRRIKRMEREVN